MSDIHIWDSHVHLFPPEIYRNWDKYAGKDETFALLTKKSPNGKGTEEAWVDYEEALAIADESGVYGLCMQGWYWNDEGLMRLHNDYMAEAIEKHPDRLKAFISVNPKFGWGALSEIERCENKGFCGNGEQDSPGHRVMPPSQKKPDGHGEHDQDQRQASEPEPLPDEQVGPLVAEFSSYIADLHILVRHRSSKSALVDLPSEKV